MLVSIRCFVVILCFTITVKSHFCWTIPDSARKATKRKVGRPKRQHTAYTMFVMENYEAIRKSNADMPSKEIISMVARQWAQVSDEEKELWKERAVSHQATVVATEVAEELIGAEYYDDVHDENKADDGTKKKRAAGPMKKAKHAIPPEL